MRDPGHSAESASRPAEQARRLRLLSSRLVTSMFAGEYRSVFRGRGIEFEEVRAYQPGDDIRSIDWNVTARSGHPYVKQYLEERELSVMLLLDRSASLQSSSPRPTKAHLAAEICALLALAAVRSHDRVGLLAFTDRVEGFLAPAKGTRQAQRVIAESLRPPSGKGTDLANALDYLNRVQRRGCVLFIISDFVTGDFRSPLAAAARRHDVVAISVTDPIDGSLPAVGLLQMSDAESGSRRLVDTGADDVRQAWQRHAALQREALQQVLSTAGVEHLAASTGGSAFRTLEHFFSVRQRRQRR